VWSIRGVFTLLGRFFSWRWYVPLLLATWVLAPEVRRIVDWRTTYHALSPFSILPLLALMPGMFLLWQQWPRLGVPYRRAIFLWGIALGYAFLVAYLSGALFSAAYATVLFGFPAIVGILMSAGSDEKIGVVYGRIANTLLWLAVIAGLYGIYQYIAPPAWDVYWAQQANIEGSQGVTESFNFRIFGTLNSTGPFAAFLTMAILFNLPRLSRARWWLVFLMVPCMIALVLTSVRAEWVALVVGTVVYVLLTPQRRPVLTSLGAVAAVFTFVGAILLGLSGPSNGTIAMTSIVNRLQTFEALQSDNSAQARQAETSGALQEGFQEPLGQGIGVTGTSAKLSGGETNSLDNGYAARFIEMGVVGFGLYIIALGIALVATFTAYRRYVRGANLAAANLAALACTVQVVLLVAEIASDQHTSLSGLFFWLSLYFASAYAPPTGSRVEPVLGRFSPLPVLSPKRSVPA